MPKINLKRKTMHSALLWCILILSTDCSFGYNIRRTKTMSVQKKAAKMGKVLQGKTHE